MRSAAGPSRNPGRPRSQGEARPCGRRPTVPPRSGRLATPCLRPLASVRPAPRGSHPRLLTLSGLQRPDLKKKKKPQSRDQRAQTAANSGSAPGGGSRGGEESPRAGARKGVAAGARAVLAPRGLGLRASADRASRGGALPPRPISGRHCRLGGGIEVRVSRRRLR